MLVRCPECDKEVSDAARICPNCGFPMNIIEYHYGNETDNTEKKSNVFYKRPTKNPNFNGVYRTGGNIEVYCPSCGSANCSHYKEQNYIPQKTKTRYTANLNPLKPFTLFNKKEKVVRKQRVVTENKFMCNRCGKIFY